MSDGKIVFSTELDNKGLEKDLSNLNKKIQKQENQMVTIHKLKSPLVEQSKQLSAQLDIAKIKLHEMQIAAEGAFSQEQIAEQKENVGMLQSQWSSVQGQVERYDRNIQKITLELEHNKERAGEIAEQLAKTGPASQKMAAAMVKANKSAQRFSLRLREVIRSALIFTLITQSLAKFREWMGKVIKSNDEATAAVARLKGALLTLAQPLVDVIIPAFVTLVNVLTALVGKAAQLMAALFGTTAESAAESAEALHEQTEALEGTGGAAKKAGKSLASFDEINKLSSNQDSAGGGSSTEAIAPDFSWTDGISEKLAKIAEDVLMIGAGFALWKIGSSIPGVLGTILTTLGGILIALGGILLFYEGFTDAWENGVDWGNLAAMIAGVAAAAVGLYAVFGPIAAGIALVVGGISLLVVGFKDVMENGANLKNTLAILAGIMAGGLGFSFLAKSPIPMFVAAIAAAIYALAAFTGNAEQLIGNVKMIFSGLLDFLTSLFTGDIEKLGDGVIKIVTGVINLVLTIFGSMVNAVIKGINWLIERINSISFTVPDWVPGIGGKGWSPNLGPIKEWQIPQLAKGAVIPPNREFMAVLGDQKSGYNIEAPEDLIRKIVREESGGGGMNTALLQAILEAIKAGKVLTVGRDEFAKLVYLSYQSESNRVGVNFAGG